MNKKQRNIFRQERTKFSKISFHIFVKFMNFSIIFNVELKLLLYLTNSLTCPTKFLINNEKNPFFKIKQANPNNAIYSKIKVHGKDCWRNIINNNVVQKLTLHIKLIQLVNKIHLIIEISTIYSLLFCKSSWNMLVPKNLQVVKQIYTNCTKRALKAHF